MDLKSHFGDIDIYLFDQLLRGNIRPGIKVLDAGCGGGRNVVYLLREGFEVFGADADARAVTAVRQLAANLAPQLPAANFRAEPMEGMTFDEGSMDVVIASAVLHFARDHTHFGAMLRGAWRVLKPGGLFFSRLASSIGIEGEIQAVSEGRFLLPDGSERYLVHEAALLDWMNQLDCELVDPLKTTVVQHQRAMTTWVVRKRPV